MGTRSLAAPLISTLESGEDVKSTFKSKAPLARSSTVAQDFDSVAEPIKHDQSTDWDNLPSGFFFFCGYEWRLNEFPYLTFDWNKMFI